MHGRPPSRDSGPRIIGPSIPLGLGTPYVVRSTSVVVHSGIYLDPRRHPPIPHRRSRGEGPEAFHESLLEPRPRAGPLVADRDQHVTHHALHMETEPGEHALQR